MKLIPSLAKDFKLGTDKIPISDSPCISSL